MEGEANGKTVYAQPDLKWLLIRNSLPQVTAWTHDPRTGARSEAMNGCVDPRGFSCPLRMEKHGVTLSEWVLSLATVPTAFWRAEWGLSHSPLLA